MQNRFLCAHNKVEAIENLVPNPKNPNKHPKRQIEMLAKIIKHQGQRAPVVVSARSGFITKGHGRLEAIKSLGWSHVAVDVQEYESEALEYADMVADNKIAELAESDDLMIIADARAFPMLDVDMLGIPGIDLKPAELPKIEITKTPPAQELQKITFLLSNEQADIISEAIDKALKNEPWEDQLNENKNGNALAALCKRYIINC